MQNKWMTREEFTDSGREGLCWVICDKDIKSAYFYEGVFWHYQTSFLKHSWNSIKAVMPIEKPEYPIVIGSYPKEVGQR